MQKTLKRKMTHDAAFQYRMGAGFPGDVNRTHPAEIEAALLDTTAAHQFNAYGNAGVIDGTTFQLRGIIAADQSNTVALVPFGALVRSFPFQAPAGSSNASQGIGAATPPTSGLADFLRSGLIMAQLNVGSTAPNKGGGVYVWAAATSGAHIQGGYETAYSAGNTVLMDPRYTYNGGMDANSVAEISFNV